MDSEKIKQGVALILEGIGEDTSREGLLDTPDRITRMCEEIFGGLEQDAAEHFVKKFHATNNNMVLEKDITFYSVCEHHLLPFYGKAHVAYIPNDKVAGLSKIARTVEVFARRPQIQRVEGTLATTVLGVMKGCSFVRVHDIKENKRVIRMTEAILKSDR